MGEHRFGMDAINQWSIDVFMVLEDAYFFLFLGFVLKIVAEGDICCGKMLSL